MRFGFIPIEGSNPSASATDEWKGKFPVHLLGVKCPSLARLSLRLVPMASAGCGLCARSSTDRALDYGSRGCTFESCRAHPICHPAPTLATRDPVVVQELEYQPNCTLVRIRWQFAHRTEHFSISDLTVFSECPSATSFDTAARFSAGSR